MNVPGGLMQVLYSKTTGISKRWKSLLTADIWDKRTEEKSVFMFCPSLLKILHSAEENIVLMQNESEKF